MKKTLGFALLLAACLCSAGCVVQSIRPWLSSETCVDDPDLGGTWHDAKGNTVAFFTGPPENYKVLLVGDGKDTSGFEATLHRVDGTLLLMVGPVACKNLGAMTTLPGHLLLKAVLEVDRLKLYRIDLETFLDRAEKSAVALLPGGSKNEGFVLTGSAAEVQAFLRAQLADSGFFEEEPLYSFQKLSAP